MYRNLAAARRVSAYTKCPDAASSSAASIASVRWLAVAAGKPFAERDVVLLRQKSDPSAAPILTKPLARDGKIQTHRGALSHADIIGKSARDLVQSSSGADFRIHHVSLHDYVRLSKRLVTPIYPADANLIVALFDLHVTPPQSSTDLAPENEPTLEILEAGTGHGSLTLHLSRAIHAANPPPPLQEQDQHLSPPSVPDPSSSSEPDTAPSEFDPSPSRDQVPVESGQSDLTQQSPTPREDNALDAWKAARRAVIHTIDISAKYSKHARKVVQGFRHGIYAGNVDFHVGDVSDWVKQEVSRRSNDAPFLTHAFLDLPSTQAHLATVASILRTDGTLIVFSPSVTQIAECMQKIKQDGTPLFLDQTLELGTNGTSGGRDWDVRVVKPRASIKKEESETVDTTPASHVEPPRQDVEQAVSDADNQKWSLVCRPKVGERVVGGGFLGVFKKMHPE